MEHLYEIKCQIDKFSFEKYKLFRFGFDGGGWSSTFNLAGSLDDDDNVFDWLDVVAPNIGLENTGGDSYETKLF